MQVINESAHMRQHRYFLALQLLKYYKAYADNNQIGTVTASDIDTYPVINTADDGRLNYVLSLTKFAIEDLWFFSESARKGQVRQHKDISVRWFNFINKAKVALQASAIDKSNYDIPYTTINVGLTKDLIIVEVLQHGIASYFSFSITDILPNASVDKNKNVCVADFPSGHSLYVR